jgi:hypothetical protein
MGILMVFGMTGMFIMYKFVLKSIWSFRNKQANSSTSLEKEIRDRLERVEKMMMDKSKTEGEKK